MNSLIKERIRRHKEEIRTFELKKESLKDKIDMQDRFIKEIEDNGKALQLKRKKKRLWVF